MKMTLPSYVLSHVATGVAMALAVILTMIVLVDIVELSRNIGDRADISPLMLTGLALLRAPNLVETTLPFVFLFGAMWGMYQLNRRSELVVMRAAGMSAWRFIGPGLAFAVAAGVVAATIINPAGARMQAEFERQRDRLVYGAERNRGEDQTVIWLRERRDREQTVVRAARSDPRERRLEDVTLFYYDLNADNLPTFSRRVDASEAVLRAGFWQLRDAWESAPDVAPQHYAVLALPTDIDPGTLLESVGAPGALDFWELPVQARVMREAGFSSVQYELRWHRLLALPLTLAAMTFIASAACLRLSRRGGALQLILTAGAVGFAVYFGDSMLAALGSTGILPSMLAAWSAPLFTLLGGFFVIATVEDG